MVSAGDGAEIRGARAFAGILQNLRPGAAVLQVVAMGGRVLVDFKPTAG